MGIERVGSGLLVLFAAAAPALAAPGDLVDHVADSPVHVIDGKPGQACAVRGGICFFAGDTTTRRAESPLLSSKAAFVTAARFARTQPQNAAERFRVDVSGWTFDLAATLAHPALPGNT